MAERVTLQDIADALGVSRNTVSKAINNTGVLAEATREKVLAKAVDMGYKQFSYMTIANLENMLGKQESQTPTELSAGTGDSKSQNTAQAAENGEPAKGDTERQETEKREIAKREIALFNTGFLGNSHFSATMLDKLQRELSQLGYSFTMHRIREAETQSMQLPASYNKERTAGIICVEMFDGKYSSMLCGLGTPILFVDAPVTGLDGPLKADSLYMENQSCIHSFVREMVRRGKKRIGFIGEYLHCRSFFERYMGYRDAMYLSGLPCPEEYCVTGNKAGVKNPQSGDYQEYLTDCFRNMESLPEVFICANDFVALDTLQAFKRLGISVPDDVWLCGFDDSPESRIVTPTLTTIHIHSQIMGFSAVHLLMSRIKEPSLNFRTIHTETNLIYRESTGD